MEEKEEVAELDEEVNGDDESSAYFSKAADYETDASADEEDS
jgi:hypothetical protein